MKKRSTDIIFLCVISLLALILRLDFLTASSFVIDSDEAIVGLMAKHILDGQEIPTFFYGQPYMGSLEAICAAILFSIFGVSTVWLKAVPLIFSILLVPITYWLGEAIYGKRCARCAAILIAIPPSPLVIWSAMARGGFIEIVCIGMLAMLFTAHWLKRPNTIGILAIGLLLGLGWWINNQIVYFIVPISLMLFFSVWQHNDYPIGPLISNAIKLIAAFMVGSWAWWQYNLTHNWESLKIFGSVEHGKLSQHIYGLFNTALPMLLGGKLFWHEEDLFPYSTLLVMGLYGAVLLFVLGMRARQILDLLRLRIDEDSPVEMIFMFLACALGAFVFSSYGHLVTAPRYLLPIYPALFILIGVMFERAFPLKRVLSFSLLLIFVGINLYSSYPEKRAIPGQPFVAFGERASLDHSELIWWLKQNGVHTVETNYWIGYRLAFETNEEVKFGIFHEPRQVRIPEYEEAFLKQDVSSVPLILVPAQAARVRIALQLAGYTWEEKALSGYIVFYKRKLISLDLKAVPADQFQVSATHRNEETSKAVDGDERTRWGSGAPQAPGMEFRVEFTTPRKLREIRYDIGAWLTDDPRSLIVLVESPSGDTKEILTEDGFHAERSYFDRGHDINLRLDGDEIKRVIFRQTGSDTYFDWSIAELMFFE